MTVYGDIAAAIATNATSMGTTLVLGTDVWSGPEQPASSEEELTYLASIGATGIADKAIFVGAPGFEGLRPQTTVGERSEIARVPVHVLIRSNPGDWDGFMTLCDVVRASIDKRQPTGYVDVTAYGSVPAIEPDDSRGCHRGRLRLEVKVRRTLL